MVLFYNVHSENFLSLLLLSNDRSSITISGSLSVILQLLNLLLKHLLILVLPENLCVTDEGHSQQRGLLLQTTQGRVVFVEAV